MEMEFSEEWKSLFPIGCVNSAPLLLSNPTTKAILGPLLFNPNPNTLIQLHVSPSLFPPMLNPPPKLSLPTFLTNSTPDFPIPHSTASSIASLFDAECSVNTTATSLLASNQLHFLEHPPDNAVILLFPAGFNHDKVGFLLLAVKDGGLRAVGDPKVADKCLKQRIARILVNPVMTDDAPSCDTTVGYLLVYTTYSVHWFSVKIGGTDNMPILGYLGCKNFKSSPVVDACWSPHLIEESLVLLENGGLFLFDLNSDICNSYFRGTKLKASWDDESGNRKWLACEFSWHPRIFIVARSDTVFLVDCRYDEFKATCLANLDMFGVYAPAKKERFLALSKADSDHFRFVLASDTMLVLCDVRKPLSPVLQWVHGLENPCHIHVLSLSELRSNSRNSAHEWATSSGFGIILGSFWNCEFGLFCYGPPLPASISSGILKISKPAYAWGLPSNLLFSGTTCPCGSCLLREDVFKNAFPQGVNWRQKKKDMVLGFGILSKHLSSLLFEPDEFGGFSLIRLMSSGKLELQRYYASWDLVKKLEPAHTNPLLFSENNLLFSSYVEDYKFPKKFKYLKLDYLSACLNGQLVQALNLKIQKARQQRESVNIVFHEKVCDKLEKCGFSRSSRAPAIDVAFNNINMPTSIQEIALRIMWGSLPMELLQLAFSTYSATVEVNLEPKKVALELLVRDMTQLPPFFLRKPSNLSSRSCGGAFVDPVIPLPVLITLHEQRDSRQEEIGGFSWEMALSKHCDEVMQVARVTAMVDSTVELDDRDESCVHSEQVKSLCLYRPIAGQGESKCGNKDNGYGFMIGKVNGKVPTKRKKVKTAGLEFFDDLCPIELKFESAAMEFSQKEMKAYKLLKKQFSKWQEEFEPFQRFCRKQFT